MDLLTVWLLRFCEYGPVFRIELFGIKNCYVVADPAALKVLLRDENSPVDIPSGGFKLLMRDLGHLQSPQQHSLWVRCKWVRCSVFISLR